MLRGIIKSIYQQADDHTNIKELAKAGSYLADDHHNLLDLLREEALKDGEPGNE